MSIEVHDSEVQGAFARLIALGTDPRPWLWIIGNNLKESTRLRFVGGHGPTGERWAPLSAVTLALRRKAGKGAQPLRDTGRLMNSITSRVGANYVEVGTNVIYARMQHFGAAEGAFGRYSQVRRYKMVGPIVHTRGGRRVSGDWTKLAGTKKGFPIPWGNVPGRPYLGISPEDRAGIIAVFAEAIDNATLRRAA